MLSYVHEGLISLPHDISAPRQRKLTHMHPYIEKWLNDACREAISPLKMMRPSEQVHVCVISVRNCVISSRQRSRGNRTWRAVDENVYISSCLHQVLKSHHGENTLRTTTLEFVIQAVQRSSPKILKHLKFTPHSPSEQQQLHITIRLHSIFCRDIFYYWQRYWKNFASFALLAV